MSLFQKPLLKQPVKEFNKAAEKMEVHYHENKFITQKRVTFNIHFSYVRHNTISGLLGGTLEVEKTLEDK